MKLEDYLNEEMAVLVRQQEDLATRLDVLRSIKMQTFEEDKEEDKPSKAVGFSVEQVKLLIGFIAERKLIHAVKLIREVTGLGLKESKELLDSALLPPGDEK